MEVRRRPAIPKRAGTSKVKAEVKTQETRILSRTHLSSSTTIDCFNFTGQVIKTLDHLGMLTVHSPVTTAPTDKSFIGCFVIRRRNEVGENTQVTEMYDAVLGNGRSTHTPESFLQELLIDINHKSREDLRRRDSIVYYTVSHLALNENGGTIYVPDVNLVIINENCNQNVIHPSSPRALDYYIDQLYDATHTYAIEINDPVNGDKPFYINLNDKVFCIQPTKNEYLGAEVRINFKAPNQPAETIYLGVIDDDALAKIGLFRTYSDADKYGAKLSIKEKEIAEEVLEAKRTLELAKVKTAEETSQIKLKTESVGLDHTLLELEKKMELMQLKHEQELAKMTSDKLESQRQLQYEREKAEMNMQQLRIKEMYEYRSLDRKDSSEFVKFMPVMIGGALALFSLLK